MRDHEDKARSKGFKLIIGVDEAGRGPLAGPVVAAAVALKTIPFVHSITDSKKMTASQRERAFYEIQENAYVGVGIINEVVIDTMNILNATFLAMNNAVEDLVRHVPASLRQNDAQICLLIDGHRFNPTVPYTYETIINGDDLVFSISCASVIAKVTRDRILDTYDKVFPQYGFRQHKGYPTLQHKKAIKEFGLSQIHRRTFQYA